MCLQYIVKCRFCGAWRHYNWDRCAENRQLLKKGCAVGLPSQHPSECEQFPENNRQRLKRHMTVYECPTKECKSTDIAAKLFEERAKVEAARAAALAKARAEWEAKDKARKAEFAEKWFKKIPVVKASERRESFLSLPPGDTAAAAAAAAAAASSSTEVAQIQPEKNPVPFTGMPHQWRGEEALTLVQMAEQSMHSQVFESSDEDDFSSASSEIEVSAFSRYMGAITIKDDDIKKRRKAIEFGDDGMPIGSVTP
ncbi:hypothetical protein MKX07_006422 [Trichoderma sp. CBMAI-0711]|uniref:Uncharacterized protein n=1 Tax=Trichoderma parareesei TaxID=858221 RepID=A0A2H2ZQH5_TRIPA|nr:hypothetical protein MKX07_006422 [Trichoderma sp. CBMAI-0711]OTA01584.1 hypothetical protein A9Z42_0019000 [Trichoderma parareesei]